MGARTSFPELPLARPPLPVSSGFQLGQLLTARSPLYEGRAKGLLDVSVRPVVRPRSEPFLETPASGSQERRAGGRGAGGRARPPVCPGGGLGVPALPAGAGGRGRGGAGRGNRGGAASRPTPRLPNNGFPLLPPAARSAPHPAPRPASERGVGGAAAAGAVGTERGRSRPDRFPVRKLAVTSEKPVGATRSQPAGVGHISLAQ